MDVGYVPTTLNFYVQHIGGLAVGGLDVLGLAVGGVPAGGDAIGGVAAGGVPRDGIAAGGGGPPAANTDSIKMLRYLSLMLPPS